MPDHPQMSELADEHGMDLHYGREAMADHVHDLHYVGGENPDVYCIDIDCNKRFAPDEVMRRLNATENLSGEMARLIFEYLCSWGKDYIEPTDEQEHALFAYAAALEEIND